jgi:hypothetical protein
VSKINKHPISAHVAIKYKETPFRCGVFDYSLNAKRPHVIHNDSLEAPIV